MPALTELCLTLASPFCLARSSILDAAVTRFFCRGCDTCRLAVSPALK